MIGEDGEDLDVLKPKTVCPHTLWRTGDRVRVVDESGLTKASTQELCTASTSTLSL